MVKSWYMKDISSKEDQRLEYHLDPHQPVNLDDLDNIGVKYWKIDVDNIEKDITFAHIRKERNYNYEDLIEIHPDTLPDYENKLKSFFKEHLHDDEEIRLIMAGSGYFDVRDRDDKWIRIEVLKGDMLVLPAGIYHRFTLDKNDYIKALRLFKGVPVWTPHMRPADSKLARQEYLDLLKAIDKEKTIS